jgi:isoleucyl-tRNA synthetase
MNFNVIPNFKIAGPIFGANIKLFGEALKNLTNEQIADINNQKAIKLNIGSQDYEITPDMVEVRITSKDGFEANMQNNLFIILNTTLNQELLDEGIARELVSKVQQMRKSSDFDIIDRIYIYYNGNDEFKRVVSKYNDFIKKETLAEEIIYKESASELVNLNGLDVSLEVSKVR